MSDPGWFADPHDATRLRYWDGVAWTGHVNPPVPVPVPVSRSNAKAVAGAGAAVLVLVVGFAVYWLAIRSGSIGEYLTGRWRCEHHRGSSSTVYYGIVSAPDDEHGEVSLSRTSYADVVPAVRWSATGDLVRVSNINSAGSRGIDVEGASLDEDGFHFREFRQSGSGEVTTKLWNEAHVLRDGDNVNIVWSDSGREHRLSCSKA
jgi:hypothetical protein